MPKSLSEQDIDEILKEIGYNDSPLRREVKQAFAKWLQQFTPDYKQDFPSKEAVFKADAQTELIAKMLRELK